jgi:hypothetical protein
VAQAIEQLQRQCFESQIRPLSLKKRVWIKSQSTQWVKSCAGTRVVWKVLTKADSSA